MNWILEIIPIPISIISQAIMEITIMVLELDREVTQWATEIKMKCKIRIRIGWDLTL